MSFSRACNLPKTGLAHFYLMYSQKQYIFDWYCCIIQHTSRNVYKTKYHTIDYQGDSDLSPEEKKEKNIYMFNGQSSGYDTVL